MICWTPVTRLLTATYTAATWQSLRSPDSCLASSTLSVSSRAYHSLQGLRSFYPKCMWGISFVPGFLFFVPSASKHVTKTLFLRRSVYKVNEYITFYNLQRVLGACWEEVNAFFVSYNWKVRGMVGLLKNWKYAYPRTFKSRKLRLWFVAVIEAVIEFGVF